MISTLRRDFWPIFWALPIAALLIYWSLDREPPVDYGGGRAEPPVQVAGGKVKFIFKLVQHRVCAAHIQPEVYDSRGSRYQYTPFMNEHPRKHDGELGVLRRLPTDMAAGPAVYRVTISWECPGNLLHQFWPITTTREIDFVVAPAPPVELQQGGAGALSVKPSFRSVGPRDTWTHWP